MTVSNYTEKDFLEKYEERAKTHRLVPFRQILELLSPVEGKSVLDLGCGTGDFSEMLYSAGAKVVGVDISDQWIRFCQEHYRNLISNRLEFKTGSGTDLHFPENFFDAVTLNMVLLNVDNFSDVEKFFQQIAKVLKPGGCLVFSELHPILIMTPKIKNRFIKHLDGFSYFKDGDQYIAGIKLENDETIEFHNRHWTLETYSKLVEKSGMYIQTIVETKYDQDAPENLRDYPIPEFILFKCVKQ